MSEHTERPGRRVLLVEDDEGLRRLISRRLGAAGVEVDESASGAEALARVEERAPDLLIVDYGLPDLSATALLDRLEERSLVVPFLVATGQGNELVAVEMMRRGARDYLVKDQRFLDQLPVVVARVLDQIEAERRLAAAESAREQSEQRLQRLVGNLGDLYFLYEQGVDGRFTFVSPSVKQVLGYEVDEFLRPYEEVLTDHPMNREARERTEKSLGGILQPPYPVEVRHRDGSTRRLEVQEVPVFDAAGRVAFVEGTARDMTQELEQRRTLRIQAAALEATINGVVISDRNGDLIWVNRAFCESTGYAREEVLGRNPRFLKSGEQDTEFYRRMWTSLVAGNTWEGEVVNRRKDGTTFCEAMTISPVFDDGGAISHFIGIKRDVTRERELEIQLRQTQRLEAIGTLAGGVAHDFNNLLTVISGFGELALEALADDHGAREAIEEIRTATERATGLTRQLLAFSRRQVVQPRVLDVNELVSGMEKMLRRLLGEDIELVCDLAPDAPRVLADPGQLEQVVMNLAVNARDAMPQGGRLTVTSRRVDGAVEWADDPLIRPGTYLLLEVRDSGSGIDATTLAHIFEPFFTTKEVGKGTGLGLATVHGIVEQAGGGIRVLSLPNEGTRFRILLPPAEEASVATPAKPLSQADVEQADGNALVLVVEDDRALLDLTGRALRSAGYRIAAAANGEEALELVASRGDEIALLVSDVVMPGLSGPELLEEIRKNRPDLPALFVSGYSDPRMRGRAALPVDTPLLAKPFTRSELLEAVRGVLGRPMRGASSG